MPSVMLMAMLSVFFSSNPMELSSSNRCHPGLTPNLHQHQSPQVSRHQYHLNLQHLVSLWIAVYTFSLSRMELGFMGCTILLKNLSVSCTSIPMVPLSLILILTTFGNNDPLHLSLHQQHSLFRIITTPKSNLQDSLFLLPNTPQTAASGVIVSVTFSSVVLISSMLFKVGKYRSTRTIMLSTLSLVKSFSPCLAMEE
jgi:hypothetical protein